MRQSVVVTAILRPRWLAVCWLVVAATLANAEPATGWVTGMRLTRQLEQPVTATWSNQPFREALASFSQTQHVAVIIDRRIDADAPLSLTIAGVPLRTAILMIAERKGIGSSLLGPVVYLGPKQTAEQLKTLAALRQDEAGKSPAGERKLLTQSRPWSWDDLAEPRKLASQLGKEARIEILGLEQIPHDLWSAKRLPALLWSDRLTLLLAQFGLMGKISADGRSVAIVPIPEIVEIERRYAGGDQPATRAARLAAQVPKARIWVDGDRLVAVGRLEDHEEISQLLSGKQVRTTTVTPGPQRYKFNVAGLPLDEVLTQLGTMLKLDVKYAQKEIQAANISLNQLITFQIENASLDELLAAVFKNTGLTFERQDKRVTVKPR